jgi:hypothetical protein
MWDIREEVLELFRALDGYGEYWYRVEQWARWQRHAKTEWERNAGPVRREKRRQWHRAHRVEAVSRMKAWRAANPEKYKAQVARAEAKKKAKALKHHEADREAKRAM